MPATGSRKRPASQHHRVVGSLPGNGKRSQGQSGNAAAGLPPYSSPFALGRPHHASTPHQGVRPQGLEGVEVGGLQKVAHLSIKLFVKKTPAQACRSTIALALIWFTRIWKVHLSPGDSVLDFVHRTFFEADAFAGRGLTGANNALHFNTTTFRYVLKGCCFR